ncbi:hypothetical protein HK100_001811 [Physocladia obscura]|uniref:Uncharacterized protein n=1 Tax=Physocladia obscura TaxID=109957 RepID=A0AAD5XBJ5_9FUNG|nr:hypothetical protein HK100_001811 [Physocladia obscura]
MVAQQTQTQFLDSPRRPATDDGRRLAAIATVRAPSVVPRVWRATTAVGVWASLVALGWALSPSGTWFRLLPASQLLVTLLGVVMGLLLVFRTNTAYDRFYEGRKMWGQLHSNVRSLARLLWVAVQRECLCLPAPTLALYAAYSVVLYPSSHDQILHRNGALRLLIAFAAATKHHMRSEENKAFLYKDVGPYLTHIPVFDKLAQQELLSSSSSSHSPSPPPQTSSLTVDPQSALADQQAQLQHDQESKKQLAAIPIEIVFRLQKYITELKATNQIDANVQLVLSQNINALADCISCFERIRSSPIPLAYALHVKQTLFIYLLSLPFQIVPILQWYTIPATIIAAFTMFGIEAIGGEIENPFGYDPNDLPQDEFCDAIRDEVLGMMGDGDGGSGLKIE